MLSQKRSSYSSFAQRNAIDTASGRALDCLIRQPGAETEPAGSWRRDCEIASEFILTS
jgi:hypothetical protein